MPINLINIMKKYTNQIFGLMAATALVALSSCSSDDGGGNNGGDDRGDAGTVEKYVVTASSGAKDNIVPGVEGSPGNLLAATPATAVQSPGDRTRSYHKKEALD